MLFGILMMEQMLRLCVVELKIKKVMAYTDYSKINLLTNLTSSDVSDADVKSIIAEATKELNQEINVRINREQISYIDNTRENKIDGSNVTYYVKNWRKFIADMDNDGIITPEDVVVYSISSDGTETKVAVKTVAGCSSYQKWGFSESKTESSPTGLANDTTVYTASISVDGTSNPISVTGSDAQTIGDLITQINLDLTGATASLVGDYIKITSDTSGEQVASSSIAITDTDLFSSLTDINESVETAVSGVSNKAYPGQFVLESAVSSDYTLYVTYEWCQKDPSEPDKQIELACTFLATAYCYAKINIGRAPQVAFGNTKIYRHIASFDHYYQRYKNITTQINQESLFDWAESTVKI